MSNNWNGSGIRQLLAGVAQTAAAAFSKLKYGVQDALTGKASTADPSLTAVDTYGEGEQGTRWNDFSDADNPEEHIWQQLTPGGASWGFRPLNRYGIDHDDAPTPISSLTATLFATTSVAWVSLSLASVLDSDVQETNWLRPLVRAVLLRVVVSCTGAAPALSGIGIRVRKKGSTHAGFLVPCLVTGLANEVQLKCYLDDAESLEYFVQTNGGLSPVTVTAEIVEAYIKN